MAADHDPDNALGRFLRERRARLDPQRFGLPTNRRRTPGLRREEVARLAHISATWYTWLEQGRGGAPSADVLDRLARGLDLSPDEREHLFLLAQNRPPAVEPWPAQDVSPALRRVLDALACPAFYRTAEWDVLACNRLADALFAAEGVGAGGPFNVLEHVFRRPEVPEDMGRAMVAAFRAEVTRAGLRPRAHQLVDDLCRASPTFQRMWAELDVAGAAPGLKLWPGTMAGPITFEVSAFAVEGHRSLCLVVFNPASDTDRERLRSLAQ